MVKKYTIAQEGWMIWKCTAKFLHNVFYRLIVSEILVVWQRPKAEHIRTVLIALYFADPWCLDTYEKYLNPNSKFFFAHISTTSFFLLVENWCCDPTQLTKGIFSLLGWTGRQVTSKNRIYCMQLNTHTYTALLQLPRSFSAFITLLLYMILLSHHGYLFAYKPFS